MSGYQSTIMGRDIANLARVGVVEEVRYDSPARARVRCGQLLTGWLRMGKSRAGDAHESWAYSEGEEVLIISTGGNLEQGVIVCALANGANPDAAAAGVHRTTYPGGVVIEVANGSVNITAPGNVRVNGDVIADGISLKTHTHGGIKPGPSDTGKPK